MPKAGIQFSKKNEWRTPKNVVDYFGSFDYDPATTGVQSLRLGIPYFDTIETDGLMADWTKYKKIWINPPFTKKFEFLKKAVETVQDSDAEVFFLIPIESMTTKAFSEIMKEQFYAMYLPNGRIKFEDDSGGGIFAGFWHGGATNKQNRAWERDTPVEAI